MKKKVIFITIICILIFVIIISVTLRCYQRSYNKRHYAVIPDYSGIEQMEQKIIEELSLKNESTMIYQSKSVFQIKDIGVFMLGIKSINDYKLKYSLQISTIDSPSEKNKNSQNWFQFQKTEFEINPREYAFKGIGIQIPPNAEMGNYRFSVNIMSNNSNQPVGVNEINFEVRSKTLWKKLMNKFDGIC